MRAVSVTGTPISFFLLKSILVGSCCQYAPVCCHNPIPITSVSPNMFDNLELTAGFLQKLTMGNCTNHHVSSLLPEADSIGDAVTWRGSTSVDAFLQVLFCLASLAAVLGTPLASCRRVAGQGSCDKLHSREMLVFLYHATLYLKLPSRFFFLSSKMCGCCLFRMSLFFQLLHSWHHPEWQVARVQDLFSKEKPVLIHGGCYSHCLSWGKPESFGMQWIKKVSSFCRSGSRLQNYSLMLDQRFGYGQKRF